VIERDLLRLAATRVLGAFSPRAFVGPLAPIRLRELRDPELPADDWVLLRTRLCGICGSDSKQVFMDGGIDNPMTALISFPQVLGHEVVGEVERAGPAVRRLRPGTSAPSACWRTARRARCWRRSRRPRAPSCCGPGAGSRC
jgi:threonine dehydrogenase-like Zn-dependent dehydrogenase